MADHYNQRTDSTQLPSSTELLDILTKESQRKAVRFDFIQKNNALFDAHRKLTEKANSDDSWIDQYETLPLTTLVHMIDKNHADIALYIERHQDEKDTYIELYDALTPKIQQAKTDALFVFGAATNARIERAIELYNQGVAPKIIISGNSPHYVEGSQSEASRMATFAEEQGIPREDLVLEESSITLPDNVKRTIDLLESMDWHPSSLTIIATNFVLTRAVMEWYKFCPWEITIIPIAAHPQSSKFTAEGWFVDPATVSLVLNDYAKIILESKIDLMRRYGEIV